MSITIINNSKIINFYDLENGELFVQVAYINPYNKTFLIKIPHQLCDGVLCNALEFDTDNQSSQGRLVRVCPANPVYRAKFTNVELRLL